MVGITRDTKRYRLGMLLSEHTRHLTLLTATPHNGKEEDFQLFLALLDSERFEGVAVMENKKQIHQTLCDAW